MQNSLPSWEELTRGNVVTDIDGNILSVPASAYERMSVGPSLFDYITDPFKPLNDWQRNYEIEAMMKREGLSREDAEFLYSISRPQTGVAPIRIDMFVNDKRLIHFSYPRYLENQLRANFDLEGTPIEFNFKNRGEE